jgi:hypothetical protein
MPWDVTIVASEDRSKPLGERDDVIARVGKSLPGVVLQQRAGPPPEMLAQMPEVIRQNFLRPKLEADFEGEGFSIQFYAEDLPTLHSIGAEVRGEGNPLPALAAVCVPNGWMVVHAGEKSVVDLSSGASPEWERFRKWRDGAIASMKGGGTAGK